MARITEKTVEVMGRKFRISAFDALTGSYIAFQVFEKMLPMGMEGRVLSQAGTSASLPGGRPMMTKEEFFSFQRDCLSVVSEVLKAGPRPVINPNGSWGVEDIKDNTMLVLLLTVHALAFNVSDFFGGDGLSELKKALSDMMPSNTPT